MYCDYCCVFFKIKCPGKIPNIQGIWEICPGNQWFQVGKSVCRVTGSTYLLVHFIPKTVVLDGLPVGLELLCILSCQA